MLAESANEARRQAEICNACRYCEGYCSVFPAMHRLRNFSGSEIAHLANLCHNCRGCYYACQYAPPHEFDVNLPKALAEVQADSWKHYAWPSEFATLFGRSGLTISAALALSIAGLFWMAAVLRPEAGNGFYAYLSHGLLLGVFIPAFLAPMFCLGISLRRYWLDTGSGRVTWKGLAGALRSAGRMSNLSGGHGDGCNYEDEDRFSHGRRSTDFFSASPLHAQAHCFTTHSVSRHRTALSAFRRFSACPAACCCARERSVLPGSRSEPTGLRERRTTGAAKWRSSCFCSQPA